jgi:hypothetical protein
MSALFKPRSNILFRTVLFILAVVVLGIPVTLMTWARTPFGTNQFDPVAQPVQFDHRHHVVDDGIDCRFCHTSVDRAASAGIPSTELCLNCHSQIWNKSALLDVVRQSGATGQPIEWLRVHRLPDFVYFNHAIHVNKGVGCASCHGRVDQMAAVQQVAPLTMSWCLDCHRNPAPHLRPPDQITNLAWRPEGDAAAIGQELMKRYDVHTRTTCTTCHR